MKGKKKGAPFGAQTGSKSGEQSKMQVVPAPANFGVCMTSLMSLRMSGVPQKCDEYEPGARIVGNSFFHYDSDGAISGAPPTVPLVTGSTSATNLFGSNTGSELSFVRRLTPWAFGTRVGTIANGFRFYAIRRVLLRYVPIAPTSTTGAVAIAVIRDPYTILRNTGSVTDNLTTPEGMLSCIPSFMTPVWEPCALTYEYKGMKVWSTWSASPTAAVVAGDLGVHVQAALGVVGSGLTVNFTCGRIALEYVIDLYEPGPLLTTTANLNSVPPIIPSTRSIIVIDEEEKEPVNVRSKSLPPSKPVTIR